VLHADRRLTTRHPAVDKVSSKNCTLISIHASTAGDSSFGGQLNTKITSDIFEAHLKCQTKCWLLATGARFSGNAYAEWVIA
jgi:hypothetical protein